MSLKRSAQFLESEAGCGFSKKLKKLSRAEIEKETALHMDDHDDSDDIDQDLSDFIDDEIKYDSEAEREHRHFKRLEKKVQREKEARDHIKTMKLYERIKRENAKLKANGPGKRTRLVVSSSESEELDPDGTESVDDSEPIPRKSRKRRVVIADSDSDSASEAIESIDTDLSESSSEPDEEIAPPPRRSKHSANMASDSRPSKQYAPLFAPKEMPPSTPPDFDDDFVRSETQTLSNSARKPATVTTSRTAKKPVEPTRFDQDSVFRHLGHFYKIWIRAEDAPLGGADSNKLCIDRAKFEPCHFSTCIEMEPPECAKVSLDSGREKEPRTMVLFAFAVGAPVVKLGKADVASAVKRAYPTPEERDEFIAGVLTANNERFTDIPVDVNSGSTAYRSEMIVHPDLFADYRKAAESDRKQPKPRGSPHKKKAETNGIAPKSTAKATAVDYPFGNSIVEVHMMTLVHRLCRYDHILGNQKKTTENRHACQKAVRAFLEPFSQMWIKIDTLVMSDVSDTPDNIIVEQVGESFATFGRYIEDPTLTVPFKDAPLLVGLDAKDLLLKQFIFTNAKAGKVVSTLLRDYAELEQKLAIVPVVHDTVL